MTFSSPKRRVQVGKASGCRFVAAAGEGFGYDLDGNLTNDGRWVFTWDAENRLTQMESRSDAPSGSKLRLEFSYDAQGRRIWKKVTSLETGGGVLSEQNFLYDQWNLLAVLDSSSTLLQSFTWGLDLSGSLQGAGGVGGLLWITSHESPATRHFAAYDGNGNVIALVNAADGTISTQYEYGPFGEPIRATGPMAKLNPFRFSTKYQDEESDLLYYGFRFYNQSVGRWLSRDPASEIGADTIYGFWEQDLVDEYADSNPYRFVINDPISLVDRFGLAVADPPPAGTSGCACKCKGLKITFKPGGDKFDPGFYQLGEDSRFGIVIIAAWTVVGDPAQCKYFAKEPDGGLTKIEGPKGKIPDSTGTPGEDWFELPAPTIARVVPV